MGKCKKIWRMKVATNIMWKSFKKCFMEAYMELIEEQPTANLQDSANLAEEQKEIVPEDTHKSTITQSTNAALGYYTLSLAQLSRKENRTIKTGKEGNKET
eukprot:12202156-Ditylum_brightwellii.AAC.1